MNQQVKTAGMGAIGFLIAAVICAGFTVYLVAMLLRDQGLRQDPTAPVLVASRDLAAGTKLAREDVRVIYLVETQIPPGAVTSAGELFGDKKTPPVAATGMVKGDFIIRSRLADAARGTAMASRIEPGFRAIAVTVDSAIARSRLVFPGARVDVVGTFRDSMASFSRVLVENVRVLSLEDQTDVETVQRTETGRVDRSSNAVVTVEVLPEQAEVVALAAREGKLDLVLRNSTDVKPGETKGVRSEQLLRRAPSGDAPAPAPAAGFPERELVRARPSAPRKQAEPPRPAEPAPAPTIEVMGRKGADR